MGVDIDLHLHNESPMSPDLGDISSFDLDIMMVKNPESHNGK